MSTQLRPVPTVVEPPKKARSKVLGYVLISVVVLALATIGCLRTIGEDDGTGLTFTTVLRGVFFTLLTGGACMVAEIYRERLSRVTPLIKKRRVHKRELKQKQREYKNAMRAINKIVSQQEAWANTRVILHSLYDRVWRQRT